MKNQVRVYEASVLDEVDAIADESIDCSVTSPPYKEKDGWTLELMLALGDLWGRALRPGGRAFLNVGPLREGPMRPFQSLDRVLAGGRGRLDCSQVIAWVKSAVQGGWEERVECGDSDCKTITGYEVPALQRGHYTPINSPYVLNWCWEPVFILYKPPERALDRLSIGTPFTDKSNAKRGTRGKNGDLHCAGDVWIVPYETTGATRKKKHGHQFPRELVRRCLSVAGLRPDSVVLDPFCGGGTTLEVGRRLGHRVVGIDVNPSAVADARARAEAVPAPWRVRRR